jgi:2'-5' RNA ligase
MSLPCEDRDFAEWHRGHPWCAVWVVCADVPEVASAVAQGRRVLARALLPRHARQPHITLAYRGLCGGGQEGTEDGVEFGRAGLLADIARLKAAGGAPFAVQVQGVESFTTVPYLAVGEGACTLAHWHAVLGGPLGGAAVEGWRYVPHVTLGHYVVAMPLRQAVARLGAAGVAGQAMHLEVRTLALVRYATRDIAGPLQAEGFFDLQTGRYAAAPGALFGDVDQAMVNCTPMLPRVALE